MGLQRKHLRHTVDNSFGSDSFTPVVRKCAQAESKVAKMTAKLLAKMGMREDERLASQVQVLLRHRNYFVPQ